eukprot:TRINITY_DN20778_c0_g1_i1.p1 TRINITY_DN20778_c0_g1~~TRINITY_DN20778_c0_g1_i1.p1  ORF type:complete len:116 (-),score=8.90 TRINITY_DN20778_c0_g1_i1:47-394(-)
MNVNLPLKDCIPHIRNVLISVEGMPCCDFRTLTVTVIIHFMKMSQPYYLIWLLPISSCHLASSLCYRLLVDYIIILLEPSNQKGTHTTSINFLSALTNTHFNPFLIIFMDSFYCI